MLLTLQCCGQDTDGLWEAMEKAVARSEVAILLIFFLPNFWIELHMHPIL